MANFKINKSAMKKLEREVEREVQKANDRANKAAARQSTTTSQARAYVTEMRKAGIDVDEKELRKQFGR